MEFDCWTGLRIEGKSYIIAEKIRYKEKTSDDVWTEYGLITTESNARTWLSISDGGLSCSLSTAAVGSKPPRGYHLHDSGTQVVTGVWGDTDASVGDEAKYEQYESADGTATFFVENWSGTKSCSAGRKIAAAAIAADETSTVARLRNLTFSMKQVLSKAAGYVAIIFGVFCVLSLFDGVTDLDARSWHSFRSFVGVPYALHERLSDAPYYTKEPAEGDAQVYRASIDKNAAALDLIEGLGGYVDEIAESDTDAPQQLIFLRAEKENLQISDDGEGKARIVVSHAPLPADRVASVTARTLGHYAETVRGWSETGRRGVVEPGPNEAPLPLPRSIYAPPPKTPPAAPAAPASTAAPSDAAAAQDKSSIMTRAEWVEKMQAASDGRAVKPSLHLAH